MCVRVCVSYFSWFQTIKLTHNAIEASTTTMRLFEGCNSSIFLLTSTQCYETLLLKPVLYNQVIGIGMLLSMQPATPQETRSRHIRACNPNKDLSAAQRHRPHPIATIATRTEGAVVRCWLANTIEPTAEHKHLLVLNASTIKLPVLEGHKPWPKCLHAI